MRTAGPYMLSAILCLLACTWAGCRRVDNMSYSEAEQFGADGWDPIRIVEFHPWPGDSVVGPNERFDLTLTLRYNADKAQYEIPILLHQEDDHGAISTDTLRLRLRDIHGNPRGRKSLALYEVNDTVRRGFKLTPGYIVELRNLSDRENTVGVLDVGLTLTDHVDKPQEGINFFGRRIDFKGLLTF